MHRHSQRPNAALLDKVARHRPIARTVLCLRQVRFEPSRRDSDLHRDSPKACKSLLEFFQASPVRPQRHLLLVAPIQGGCLAARTTSRRPAAARSRTHQRTALVSHLLDLTIALQPALPAGPLHSSDPSGPFASFRSTVTDSQTSPQQRIALISHLSLDLT